MTGQQHGSEDSPAAGRVTALDDAADGADDPRLVSLALAFLTAAWIVADIYLRGTG